MIFLFIFACLTLRFFELLAVPRIYTPSDEIAEIELKFKIKPTEDKICTAWLGILDERPQFSRLKL